MRVRGPNVDPTTFLCSSCKDPARVHFGRGFCRACHKAQYIPPLRECLACREIKPHASKGMCKLCYMSSLAPKLNERRREAWLKRPKEERALELRTNNLKYKYGLTQEQVNQMAEAQSGICALCPKPYKVVDHCHATGRVRGLLCRECNLGLGHFKDHPERLELAAAYLRR